MFFNAQKILNNRSIINVLTENKEKELSLLLQRVESIINFEECKNSIEKAYNKARSEIEESYSRLIESYVKNLENCLHEILFYLEDEDRYVCACCDKEEFSKEAVVISLTSEEYNDLDFVNDLRNRIISYLFFAAGAKREDVEKDFSKIKLGSEEMSLKLKKKGDWE